MNDVKNLAGLLDEVRLHLRGGDNHAVNRSLRALLSGRAPAYHHARTLERLAEYASYLYMALFLDLDDDEAQGIEAAELAYAGLAESMLRYPEGLYEITRHRIFLLHHFADYLADCWMDVFMKAYKRDHLLYARNRALDTMKLMLLSDMRDLERAFAERVDADGELNDICNTIHFPEPPTDSELAGAAYMHKMFHAYLKAKHGLAEKIGGYVPGKRR
jgi:hypothetical protein